MSALVARADLIMLAALLASIEFLPRKTPPGIVWAGGVEGLLVALQAAGVVLVLRSHRIINFAQLQLGALSGVVFYELVHHSQFIWLLHYACSDCVRGLPNDSTSGVFLQSHSLQFMSLLEKNGYTWMLNVNFGLSLVVALVLAPLLALLLQTLVIERFARAPRLILTVVTIGLGSALSGLVATIGSAVFMDAALDLPSFYTPIRDFGFYMPLDSSHIFRFHPDALIRIGVAVIVAVGLTVFFLRSRTGILLRGSAENATRAQTLGINTGLLGGVVWTMAGTLSGLAAMLAIVSNGSSTGALTATATGAISMVPVLAAVVFARMRSLPIAFIAALALGIIQRAAQWTFSSAAPYDAALVLVIAGSLLLQRVRVSRAEEEATAGYLGTKEARPIPPELRHHPAVENYIRYAAIIGAIVFIGGPFVLSPGQNSAASFLLITAIIGLSLLILTGWAGQISLGQIAFAAVGAYVVASLRSRFGVDVVLCLLAGGVAGSVAAVLVGLPALRLRGMFLAITTLAFGVSVSELVLGAHYLGQFLPAGLDRPILLGFSLDDEKTFYYFCLGILCLVIVSVAGVRRSRAGRALIALRDNENAGQSFGLNVFRIRMVAFALSGFYAAVAGGLLALHQHGVFPADYDPNVSINLFLMTVMGGLGSIGGPVVGALYQGSFQLFPIPLLALLGSGLGVVAILMVAPGGLIGLLYQLRETFLRRVAVRHRVFVPSLLADMRSMGLNRRGHLAAKARSGGGTIYVPERYRLQGQWVKLKEEDGA